MNGCPTALEFYRGPGEVGKQKSILLPLCCSCRLGRGPESSARQKVGGLLHIQAGYSPHATWKKGIKITKRHVVRFYASTTEANVIKPENIRYVPPSNDPDSSRWRPMTDNPLPTSVYDQITNQLIKKGRGRPYEVSDRRYIFPLLGLDTLLLKITNLHTRTRPTDFEAYEPQSAAASQSQESHLILYLPTHLRRKSLLLTLYLPTNLRRKSLYLILHLPA